MENSFAGNQSSTRYAGIKDPRFCAGQGNICPWGYAGGAVSVKCNIAVAGCDVKNGIVTGGVCASILYDYNEVKAPCFS